MASGKNKPTANVISGGLAVVVASTMIASWAAIAAAAAHDADQYERVEAVPEDVTIAEMDATATVEVPPPTSAHDVTPATQPTLSASVVKDLSPIVLNMPVEPQDEEDPEYLELEGIEQEDVIPGTTEVPEPYPGERLGMLPIPEVRPIALASRGINEPASGGPAEVGVLTATSTQDPTLTDAPIQDASATLGPDYTATATPDAPTAIVNSIASPLSSSATATFAVPVSATSTVQSQTPPTRVPPTATRVPPTPTSVPPPPTNVPATPQPIPPSPTSPPPTPTATTAAAAPTPKPKPTIVTKSS